MTLAEIKSLIAQNDLHPIPVLHTNDEESEIPRFAGEIAEFWPAAKALGAKAVFCRAFKLDDSDFQRSKADASSIDDDVEDADPEDLISLEDYSPQISKFRKHIGKEVSFLLRANGENADLEMLVLEDWWKEFLDAADEAVVKWQEEDDKQSAAEETQREADQKELMRELNGLVRDSEFCAQTTQRAMRSYAIEKLPGLEDVEPNELTWAIQKLHDEIRRKGLHKKR